MFHLKEEHILLVFEKVTYLTLLSVGIFFIYQGDVIQRFQTGKTSFVKSSEAMTEMPSIRIRMSPTSNPKVGIDFNVSLSTLSNFSHPNSMANNLTFGKNNVTGSDIKFEFLPFEEVQCV